MQATPTGRRDPLATGVIVGLTAAWIKGLAEPVLQSAAERILPPTAEQKLEVGADVSGRPENMPPSVLTDRVVRSINHHGLSTPQRLRAQNVIHYGFGTGLGIAYSAAASRWPGTSRGRGALAGLAIYAGSHGSTLPALGIQRPPWRLAPAAVAWELTSHLVFGAAMEAVRCSLEGRR